MQVIGIDVGGTEIKAALVNDQGILFDRVSVPTPVQEGAKGILSTIKAIITNYQLTNQKINHVGIGAAGRIDPMSGKVIYATDNLPKWTGVNIKQEIEKHNRVHVQVDNDVNVAAIGEQWVGAAKGVEHFGLVTIGTGFGGAFFYDGNIVHGPTGSVAEIGHMIIYPHGRPCNCGQRGCVEQYVSGTGLNNSLIEVKPEWNTYLLLEQYEKEDPIAMKIMDQFLFDFSLGLINIQNIFDPKLIVIGGGFGETFGTWASHLKQKLNKHTKQDILLKKAELGNDAGIIGAAKLALDSK